MSTLPFMLDYGMDTQYPTDVSAKTPDQFVKSITTFDYDYDYGNVKQTYDDSIWGDISQPVKATGGFVWDAAKGTWATVKEGASSVANAVDSAGTALSDKIFGGIDSLLWRAVLIFGVIILGLYILGKSGIIKDVVGGILAVKT